MKSQLIKAIKIFVAMTLLTGVIYPLLVLFIGQILFPYQSSGSMILKNGKVIGSELIGQNFSSQKYFWSRPSAINYNPLPSGASNLALTNKKLFEQFKKRKTTFFLKNKISNGVELPAEMLFASASGIDPHISTKSAYLQFDRIVSERNFNADQKERLFGVIKKLSQNPQLGFLGKERINVLLLNVELDKIGGGYE